MARTIHGQRINLRISTFPVQDGENLVLRVLDKRRGMRSLVALCSDKNTHQALGDMVRRPNGLVVVCGPTGSGKTTTLYAMLQSLDASSLNIMTLEDPIEYPIPNVCQTRVNGSTGFGYADGVKGVLRQDPDVLLIGEIRDSDSCMMALRAAMTGHLVLTSTHADHCIGAISRLIELGASRLVLGAVLAGVISQRLLRKVCSYCYAQSDSCGVCRGAGYCGRIPLFECLNVSHAFTSLLHGDATADQLLQQAHTDGMTSLSKQADELLAEGKTTVEEVCRVMGLQDYRT